MGFYESRILPHVINCACGMQDIMEQRRLVVPQAEGEVLEVGMGSGLNLAFYDPSRVTKVWGVEPSPGMRDRAEARLGKSPVPVEWLGVPGEQIPLGDASVDTVVLTFTLCTIPDWLAALKHMRRVLRSTGQVLFCEHGQAPDAVVRKWQDRLNPAWRKLAGGCNLNRPVERCLQEGGFVIKDLHKEYMPRGPKIAGFMYRGVAVPI